MTTPAERVKAVFDQAAEIAAPADREAFLEQACGGAEVRARVEALLRAHAEAGSFLGLPPLASAETHSFVPGDSPTRTSPAAPESPGTVIGPYKLLQQIGEGGMGTVYMAEQTEPVKRKVALKLIKAGMDSRQVIARFEAERQALAMMDHVNIARVFDGGTTENGRPYFVMELVHGVPITKYCDDNHLTPRQRLELFVPVCQAIQHAHQKGIIHRDVKPSNVMVTLYDGKPVPKVIDFGVAKATEQKLTERTLFTQYGTMIGTLEYMSPEQAEMSALGVDTRSDIYSLGVLLYELLTGSTPLTHKRMKEVAYGEILRMIKEEEPPKPSTRLSDSGEALASISALRHTEPAKLTKLMRGELDWIVMKCLEKDRNRRYETANAFAADVQRYLADEPVLACPPSRGYRFRKFARRNMAALTTVAFVVAALVLGTVVSTWQAVRATKAEGLAQTRLGETEEAHKGAVANLQKAREAVDQMLTRVADEKLLNVPQMEPLRKALLQDALKFYEEFLKQKGDDPELRLGAAVAWQKVGGILGEWHRLSEAANANEESITLLEKLVGEFPAETRFRVALAESYLQFGMMHVFFTTNQVKAEEILRRASTQWEQVVAESPGARRFELSRAACEVYQGISLKYAGRLAEAEALFQRAEAHLEEIAGDVQTSFYSRAYLGVSCHHRAGVLASMNRPQDADKVYRKALIILEKVAAEDPTKSSNLHWLSCAHAELGALLQTAGHRKEAEESYRRALAIAEPLATNFPMNPNNHWACVRILLRLGSVLAADDRLPQAEQLYRRALATAEKAVVDGQAASPWHLTLLIQSQSRLANSLRSAGRRKEAEQVYRQATEVQRKLFERTPLDADSLNRLAWNTVGAADAEFWDAALAVEMAKKAVALKPNAGYIWNTLGAAHYRSGDWKAAVVALGKSTELRKGDDGFDWLLLAMAHWQLGDKDQATKYYKQAIEWMDKHVPRNDELGRFRAEAEQLLGIQRKTK